MSDTNWIAVGTIRDIPRRSARVVKGPDCDIAVFRTVDDRIFALEDRCPHKHGPLSQGIVHGHRVTCPLHDWVIDLAGGEALGNDKGCTRVINVRIEEGSILLDLAALRRRAA